jgi:hypothetical protein
MIYDLLEKKPYPKISCKSLLCGSCFNLEKYLNANDVIKLMIGSLPNSHLDAKFEAFLSTLSNYLQNLL